MDAEGVVEGGKRYPSTISIMVVDDDVTTLNIVSAMLKTWSYDVVTVPNPIEALSILRKGKYSFDLVVTDLHMPQMNGLELQKLVHEEFELPVIMMSADDKESVILKSLEGGVFYYIVKPVSKDDMKLVWQCIVQSRKSRSSNVTIEEMLEAGGSGSEFVSGQLRQGPSSDQLEDLDCASFNNHDFNHKEHRHHKKVKSSTSNNKNKTRKRDRNTDDDEEDDESEHNRRLLAKKKAKVVWSNALHNHFLMAIRHIGLDKAVPKRILEFMNVPGLTRENVASHLQKYRMFLKRVAEKARLSKCLSERIFRSSLLSFGLPATPSFNHVQREQYAEYLKQQLQLNDLGLNNSLAPVGTTSASHLGFPMNYNQQQLQQPAAAAVNHLASTSSGGHPLYGSGQSHLLMNNATLQQQRPMQLGNGMNMFSNYGFSSGFGMPMMNNNVGRTGGYGGAMNNVGNGFMNGGTSWMDTYSPQQSQDKQLQQALNFTSNPFSFGNTSRISSPSIDNMMSTPPLNNANHFGGRASGFNNNVMNVGYNGLTINNEVVNGLTNGVRNVNLNDTTFNALGNNVSSTAGSFAAPVLARNSQQQQQQNASPLLQGLQQNPFGKGSNDFSFSGLMNNAARTFNRFSMTNDDDDIMVINNLVMQQIDNCQPPPPHQKQSGEDSFSFNSMFSQDENPAPTPMSDAQVELHPNRATNGLVKLSPDPSGNGEVHLQLNPDPFANGQVQLNSNPFVNGQDQQSLNPDANSQLHLNPTANLAPAGNLNLSSSSAANSQLDELNQTGNPNSFGLGSSLMRDDVQSWSLGEKGGGDQQMILNSEVNNNMFQQTDDYSSLFAAQEDDDDFLNALIGFDS